MGTGAAIVMLPRALPLLTDSEPIHPDRRVVSDFTLDLYRSEFAGTRGSSQGFSPHCVNCKGNCLWQVFENGGRVVREEQFAGYPQIAPNIPDANPRGCNKGAFHSQSLYSKDRLLYPLKRAGARGEGKWSRISWDEALDEIADKVVDLVSRKKFEELMIYAGTGVLSPVRRAASLRLASLLGAVRFNVASAVGDMFPGATITYGLSTIGCTSEAWYTADYVLIWGCNPTVSRIPDAHYLWEGKYRGSRVVTISPDYNATARQSSAWVPIKPGTDSYLAMSMVNVIIEEGLYRKRFIREQTDLPFLVKVNDGHLLRQSDMFRGGNKEIFYFYDEKTGQPIETKGSKGSTEPTLRLGGVRPALEGVFDVKSADGQTIKVTTVFAIIRDEARKFTPESTRRHTGIHPSVVRREVKKLAKAKVALIMQGYRIHKYFWGSLACRGAALILALTGHAGRKGGLDIDNEWGLGALGSLSGPKPGRMGSGFLGEWADGNMQKSFLSHYKDEELFEKAGVTKKELINLADDAVKKQGFAYYGKPKVMMLFHDNKFVRNSAQKQTENLLDGVDLYVNVNYRLDSSAALADIVLPTLTNYESYEMRLDPGYSRFANIMIPPTGLKAPGEAKSEWEICALLAGKIQTLARKKNIRPLLDAELVDPEGKQVLDTATGKTVTRDLQHLHQDFVTVEPPPLPGTLKPAGQKSFGAVTEDKTLLEWVMTKVPAVSGWDLDKARRTGFFALAKAAGQTSPLYPDAPFFPLEPQVYLKQPYSTVSGRQQFYVDHDLYLKIGCASPTAREPVRPNSFPLAYYSAHTRYGINSTWRASRDHLRLQRGIPHLHINPETAERRGIKDGDRVRVFNDVGDVYMMAKLHPGTPPEAVWTEHAWENYQFSGGKGINNVVPGIVTPLELAGNWGHLVYGAFWDGNQLKGETSVEIEKA